jgi:DNA-binding beta-propeller fold protein YncE
MGVAWWKNRLFVADTYNNKVKVIDLLEADIRTVAGEATSGSTDLPPRFDEPAGLSVADGMIFVADTNNHLIRVIDIETGKVKTLALDGLLPPSRGSRNAGRGWSK